MDIGGSGRIEPHTRVVAQGLTSNCDQIVTAFWLQCLRVSHFNDSTESAKIIALCETFRTYPRITY